MTAHRSSRRYGSIVLLGLVLAQMYTAHAGFAHTFEPCLLTIRERAAGEYDVVWRPAGRSSGYNLSSFDITPVFAPHCRMTTIREDSDELATTTVSRLDCLGSGLRGTTLRVPAIDGTQLDVVVRVTWLDQSDDTTVLRGGDSSYTFRDDTSRSSLAAAMDRYVRLGIEHILLGFDHLAFVLALFLLIPTGSILLKTITAFTVGHSLTLALATFHVVTLPTALTEALIALSIAFVAREVLLPDDRTLAHRNPWLVALAFGLLHGLGFAAALDDLGFANQSAVVALLGFNLGVELGQAAFIAVLVAATHVAQRLAPAARSRWLLPYAIGSVAFVWVFERVAGFWP